MTAERRSRVFMVGATGTIGRATVRALVRAGYEVVCFVRARAGVGGALTESQSRVLLSGAEVRFGRVEDVSSVERDGFRGESFDVVMSCLASRTGAPDDAWAIDYQANANVLSVAKRAGVRQMVLLSAICVQKPQLAFQQAKLKFEQELIASGLRYSIVRATAFFKSLSGQVERVRRGKSFLLFGNGQLTACKPISDNDLATFLVECISDVSRHNMVLPIGGPGNAITPREQGDELFRLFGRAPKFTRVPVAMLDVIVGVLSTLGRVVPSLKRKAELARIGRYYATESMLVWDSVAGRYSADATPSAGSDTLFEHYASMVRGEAADERGDHAVF